MKILVTGGALARDAAGKFVRVHEIWSLENFDDGYVDADGRFRVYMPEHQRAADGGYILRAIVAWEAYHKETVELGFEIHHRNEDRLDDSKENLAKLTNSAHQLAHKGSDVELHCKFCGKKFTVKRWRIRQRIQEGFATPGYCSQLCFQLNGKSKETKKKISATHKSLWKEKSKR